MIRILSWILSIPGGESGKSGKRELAVIFALFTLGMIVWSWAGLSEAARLDILFWLVVASLILLCAAFGMESLISQAGLRLGRKKIDLPEEENFE